MRTETEINVGDKVKYVDNDFDVETVVGIMDDYVVTDRTQKLEGADRWVLKDKYKVLK